MQKTYSYAKHTFFAATLIALSACSNQKTLLIKSIPSGAVVVDQNSGNQIKTPYYVTYPNLKENMRGADGCFIVAPVNIYWESGASIRQESGLRLCGGGPHYEIIFRRPEVPGIEKDIAVANLQQQQISNQQAYFAAEQSYRSQAAQAQIASTSGYLLGCALAGGCNTSQTHFVPPHISNPIVTNPSASVSPFPSSTIAPDGTFVAGPSSTLCPDGTYVGGRTCILAPDGTFVAY